MKKIIIVCLSFIMVLIIGIPIKGAHKPLQNLYKPLFDIIIQDTVLIMEKENDAVALKIKIIKHVDEDLELYDFYQYARTSCWGIRPAYGHLERANFPGLYYYLEDNDGNFLDEAIIEYDVLMFDYCRARTICVDTINLKTSIYVPDTIFSEWKQLSRDKILGKVKYNKKAFIKHPCDNPKLSFLNTKTFSWTIYPTIKNNYSYDYIREHILPQNNEFYLTLYYFFPIQDGLPAIVSNKVKLIIK